MRAHHRASQPNPSHIHLLRDRHAVTAMARSAAAGPGDLVFDIGAGTGVLTASLAATGARVIAVERSPALVARLERRFAAESTVRVVEADARAVPLPRRAFSVVSNIPYSISTALIRRLLSPLDAAMVSADLVLQWGMAKHLTEAVPRNLETAWWQARFEITIASKLRPRSFNPPPSVDSAHVVVRRRSGMGRAASAAAFRQLRAEYGVPSRGARLALEPERRRARALGLR